MTASILLGLALAAGAPEPVVWTKMADPDPRFVAPKASDKPARPRAKAAASGEPDDLDSAMINLMQADAEMAAKAEREYQREVRRLEGLVERSERAAQRGEAESDPPQY